PTIILVGSPIVWESTICNLSEIFIIFPLISTIKPLLRTHMVDLLFCLAFQLFLIALKNLLRYSFAFQDYLVPLHLHPWELTVQPLLENQIDVLQEVKLQ